MLPLEIHIPLKIREDEPIKLKVSEGGGGGGDYPYYSGQVVVTPKVRESTELRTKDTIVLQNIMVEEIPYYETSNLKGTTFIVGGN